MSPTPTPPEPLDLPVLVEAINTAINSPDEPWPPSASDVLGYLVLRLNDLGHTDVELVCSTSKTSIESDDFPSVPVTSYTYALRQGPVVAGWYGESSLDALTATSNRGAQLAASTDTAPTQSVLRTGDDAFRSVRILSPVDQALVNAVVDQMVLTGAIVGPDRPRVGVRM